MPELDGEPLYLVRLIPTRREKKYGGSEEGQKGEKQKNKGQALLKGEVT